MKALLFFASALLVLDGRAAGQNQKVAPPVEPSTLHATAQEVVLDMVFRTKKGKSVRDITPEEVHVYEDGVAQKLNSLRLVSGTTAQPLEQGAPQGTAATAAAPLDPMREIRLVTLVFEGLDVDGKRFFRQAVKDILDMTPEQNLYYSLFAIDQKLHCLQPFTADHKALMSSLERSAAWSFIQYATQSAEIKERLSRLVSGDTPLLQGGQSGGPSQSQVGGMVAYRLAKMQYDMLQAADMADREYDVRATISALTGLVRQLSTLPGRKVILYFNPWFQVTEAVKERYTNMISTANRGNVTFYTVDTKGLVTYSQNSAGQDLLNQANRESRDLSKSGGTGPVSTQQARASETAETSMRSNPLMWLRDLAQNTGGTAVGETNDWKAPLRLAMDEVRTYYEASYTPQIATYDGKFRKISVKIDRPDVQVHTRSGYYALPVLSGLTQLYSYELPLLNSLSSASPPADVSFRAAAQRFDDRGPKVEFMVTVEAPLKGLVFEPSADKKSASVDAGLLTVLKDQHGDIVEKFSKDFAVQVDLDKMEAYKQGNLVQTFHTRLAPGDYALETAVMDRHAGKTGVKRSMVHVPQPSTKLSLSDVVIVRRTDTLKDNAILDAFYFEGGKIVPTLTETLKGGPGNVLPFYFAVYQDASVKELPKLTMAFYKDGEYLGAAEAPLPAPQKDGRIPYIANLPADRFVPGSYEIRIGVLQGQEKAEEKVAFRID